MAQNTATAKPPPPQPKRRISQISMAAVVLAPLTEEEADQITLFMLPGGLTEDGEVQCQWGEEEKETLFFRGPQGKDQRSPFERAMLLFDVFQSADNVPTVVTSVTVWEIDFGFAEFHSVDVGD